MGGGLPVGVKNPGAVPQRGHGRKLNTILGWFLVMFTAAEALGLGLPILGLAVGVNTGLILPANSCEESVGEYAMTLMGDTTFRPSDLPSCSAYMVLDSRLKVQSSNMDARTRSRILDLISANGVKAAGSFVMIPQEKGYVVISYQMGARYAEDGLNRVLPSPETVLNGCMAVNVILVAVVGILLLGRHLRRGVAPLSRAVDYIGAGNLDFAVGSSTVREFDQVLGSMDVMKTNLRSSLESEWRTQEESRQRTAALAHDLKTPLTGIAGWADLLGEADLDADQTEYLNRLASEEKRMEELTSALIQSSLSTPEAGPERRYCDLSGLVNTVIDMVRGQVLDKSIDLEIGEFTADEVNLDADLTVQALGNVLVNAVEHTPDQGRIRIGVELDVPDRQMMKQPGCLVFTVEDSGPGFTRQDLERATEQSYMGDPSRSGHHFGLGLSVAKRDAQEQGGDISLGSSADLGGAKVVLTFRTEGRRG